MVSTKIFEVITGKIEGRTLYLNRQEQRDTTNTEGISLKRKKTSDLEYDCRVKSLALKCPNQKEYG